MNIKYIQPKRLKVLIALFFGTAGMGIFVGLVIATGIQSLYITFLGVVNLCLGGLVAYILLTQKPKVRDTRKK
jgi:predicted benzoate:H+ symporter BenE|tara:strand:+ start:1541 stop:1759 length:219 start_codon:yes stop_codon:yes gene_type:complete